MSEIAGQLDLLWKLRDLDAQVHEAQERVRRAERDFAGAQAVENSARKRLEDSKLKLRDLQNRERDTEIELKSMQKRLRLLEDQANSATSDSIRHQSVDALENHRRKLSETEDSGLAMLDQIEAAKAAVTAAEEAMRAASDKAAAANGALAGQQAMATAKHAEVDPLRQAQAGSIKAELLQAYEGARTRHPDSPICGIKDNYCICCSGELTLHHVNRVKGRTEVLRCPHCSRIHDIR